MNVEEPTAHSIVQTLLRTLEDKGAEAHQLSTGDGVRHRAMILAGGLAFVLLAGIAGAGRAAASNEVTAALDANQANTLQSSGDDRSETRPANNEAEVRKPAPRKGRLFARGFIFQNDELQGMSIVSIDPVTGSWKRLVDPAGTSVAVSPDRQTIYFEKEGSLWNGDAESNANPGKVYDGHGLVVFSPDNRSILLTTWKPKPDKPDATDINVIRMGLDGTGAVSIAGLAGWEVHDWSPDGRWLIAQKNWAVFLIRPDGTEHRQLVQQGDGPRFSPDGKQVIYATSWKGTIRLIDIDGSNDRVFVQAADQTFIARPHFSPDGKHIAAVSHDLQNGSLHADLKVSHPHLVIYDAGNPELHVLELPVQEDSTFYPTGELEWR